MDNVPIIFGKHTPQPVDERRMILLLPLDYRDVIVYVNGRGFRPPPPTAECPHKFMRHTLTVPDGIAGIECSCGAKWEPMSHG
jgi:hypothetical protein